jgi:hypothetical protein
MPHRSRLSREIARANLHCVICKCTENKACILENGKPCSWVSPGLCNNPACIAQALVNDPTEGDVGIGQEGFPLSRDFEEDNETAYLDGFPIDELEEEDSGLILPNF